MFSWLQGRDKTILADTPSYRITTRRQKKGHGKVDTLEVTFKEETYLLGELSPQAFSGLVGLASEDNVEALRGFVEMISEKEK